MQMVNYVTTSTGSLNTKEAKESKKEQRAKLTQDFLALSKSGKVITETELKEYQDKMALLEEQKIVDQPLEKPIDEYTAADIAEKSEAEIKKDVQKDLAKKAMENVGGRQDFSSKEDQIAYLTKQLNAQKATAAKKEEESRESLFAKETMSPKELFNRYRLRNVYQIMKKLKASPGYPKQAIVYFMSMEKSRLGRKLKSPLKRAGLELGIAPLFDVKMEDFNANMKKFKERFKPKEGDPEKVAIMKKEIYNMAVDAGDLYLEQMTTKNKMKKL